MNSLAHAIVSYAIGARLTDDPALVLLAVFFGVLPDLDHLPHLATAVKTWRFGPKARSRYHELYGLTLASVAAVVAYAIDPTLAYVIFLPLLAHHLMDFVSRPTRPFNPVDDTSVHLKLYPTSLRGLAIADTMVTILLAIWLIL